MRKMLLMIMIAAVAVSCSNLPKEREVNVSDVETTGFIKNYLQVVDGTYKFTNDGQEGRITVKFKLLGNPTEDFHKKAFAKIRINAVGENGEIFDTGVYGFQTSDNEFTKVKELLETGNVGDTKSISFIWHYLGQDKDLASRIFNEATTFELIDDGFEAGLDPKSTDVEFTEEGEDFDAMMAEHNMNMDAYEAEEETVSTGSSAEYDKWLDDYEEYFKTLAKICRKMENGDNSAYSEYVDLLQKIESLYSRLSKVQSHMTSAQVMRLTEIVQKYSQDIQP